jgi:N-acetyl-1-D-myo-inositol-2-amino-2-deoxy-alpha-D-glucopyranoside deacetylase/mycothiol S-conjugate amidase
MKAHPGSISDVEHTVSGEKLALLAVFARPEEEAFGPSGTLARYAGEGVRVSLITAARELASMMTLHVTDPALILMDARSRETSCSCRAAGISRMCLDHASSYIPNNQRRILQERLVRLIREVKPQVIVTYGPNGLSGESEQKLLNELATYAFEHAGDYESYPEHFRDGLNPYQPSKLYYSVLPQSWVKRWGLNDLNGVPDEQVTTVLDVSPYSEMKLKAVYCQRHHSQDYARWRETNSGLEWNEEHFILAATHLGRRTKKEKDLFAGIR